MCKNSFVKDCSNYTETIRISLPDANLVTKYRFNFNDGTYAEFDNAKDLQEILDKVQKLHDIEKEKENLYDDIKLLKSALKYSNTTAKVALDFIHKVTYGYDYTKLTSVIEEMLEDTGKTLKLIDKKGDKNNDCKRID